MQNNTSRPGRTPPENMPRQVPRPDQNALRGKTAAQPPMQQPLTDEENIQRRPSLIGRILRRIALFMLLMLALVLAYLFLLLGEPEDDAEVLSRTEEQIITMPMGALDVPGESDGQKIADAFGQPVLMLSQQLTMSKSRIYDTAFEGQYARCVTITYTFEDGQQLLAESLRPTSAVTLLRQADYTLDASALYSMGGLNAARMQNDTSICVFAQSDTAVYAVTCPISHAEELSGLLRYTTLVAPSAGE